MERSRRRFISGSILVSIVAVAVLLLVVLASSEVLAQNPAYFVICKHEDLDRDRVWQSMQRDPPLKDWWFHVQHPDGPWHGKITGDDGCVEFDIIDRPGTYTVCEQLQNGWINSYRYPSAGSPPGGELCTSEPCCMSYDVPLDYEGPIEILFGNYRPSVGGETEPASKLALLAPWLGIGALVLFVGIAVASRVRKGSSA